MKQFIKVICLTILLYPITTIASKNPIKWQLNRTLQTPLVTGRTYTITYTFTNQIPLRLIKAINISKLSSPVSEFSYVDNCSGKFLNPNETCTVDVTITPLSSGAKYFQLTIDGYSKDQVKLPEITTIAIGSAATGVVSNTSQSLAYQMTQGTNGSFTFTFTNEGSTEATNVIGSLSQTNGTASILENTCGDSASPGTIANKANNGSCYISGNYSASVLGEQTVTATLTFSNADGSPSTAQTYTDVVSSSESGDILGSLISPYYLPPVMTQNTAFPTKFLFTNVSTNQVDLSGTNVGSVSCLDNNSNSCGTCDSSGCTGTLSSFSSSCNDYLPYTSPAAACELQATFTSPAATSPITSYTLTASVPYTGDDSPATIKTTGTVVTTLPTTRTITVINDCDFDVWFSLNGASVPGSCSTTTSLGCPDGASCNTNKGTCFWSNPAPNSAGSGATPYNLVKNGGENTVTILANNIGGVQWSGNISASLNCNNTSSCQQAGCNNAGGSSSCYPGQGFTQPATEAEITMNVSSSDSYDVGTINGFHIPVTMQPVYYDDGTTEIAATANGYTCGSPGAYGSDATNNSFGSCDWSTVSLPSPASGTGHSSGYYWVTTGGSPCDISNASSQCGSTQLCGIAIDTSTDALSTICGNFLGYWTGDQVCSYSNLPSSIESFFGCSTKLSTLSSAASLPFPSGATLYDLMSCSVPNNDPYPLYNSCYNSYANSSTSQIQTCCGCVDWWDVPSTTSPGNIGSNPDTQSCGTQIDPVWTQYIQPMVQWMKNACPSAYTYQFDDKTSGFSCSNNLPNESNSVDYVITFCKGNTGLPSGITDGR